MAEDELEEEEPEAGVELVELLPLDELRWWEKQLGVAIPVPLYTDPAGR